MAADNFGITIEQARKILLGLPQNRPTEEISLTDATGRILSDDVIAASPLPPFARSPYDGYALRGEDTVTATEKEPVVLHITEEIPAGKAPSRSVGPMECAKILTGAPIPEGANTTVKYEQTAFDDQSVQILHPLKPHRDIVPAGEDVAAGTKVGIRGSVVTPAVVGLLAAIGAARVRVYARPQITVFSTGSELVDVDCTPGPAQIRNSNYYTIKSLLETQGAFVPAHQTVSDDLDAIADAMKTALTQSQMVLTTGGASVGDYDLIPAALERIGAALLFRKVSMKPGSAILAGEFQGKLILGLSGNPAAAMVGLYTVGMPYIRSLLGRSDTTFPSLRVLLRDGFDKASPQRRFLRGRLEIEDGTCYFRETGGQGNGTISSFVGCDLLADIPEGAPALPAGAAVSALYIGAAGLGEHAI